MYQSSIIRNYLFMVTFSKLEEKEKTQILKILPNIIFKVICFKQKILTSNIFNTNSK